MQLPAEPTAKTPIDVGWGRQVVRCLRSLTGRSSATVRVRRGPNGTTYDANIAASAAQSPSLPFAFSPASPPDGDTSDDGPWGQISLKSWLMGWDPTNDGFDTSKTFGIPLTGPTSDDGSGGMTFVQQLANNLLLVNSCFGGQGTFDCQPSWGPQPDDANDDDDDDDDDDG
jgi:hypothetical protein